MTTAHGRTRGLAVNPVLRWAVAPVSPQGPLCLPLGGRHTHGSWLGQKTFPFATVLLKLSTCTYPDLSYTFVLGKNEASTENYQTPQIMIETCIFFPHDTRPSEAHQAQGHVTKQDGAVFVQRLPSAMSRGLLGAGRAEPKQQTNTSHCPLLPPRPPLHGASLELELTIFCPSYFLLPVTVIS